MKAKFIVSGCLSALFACCGQADTVTINSTKDNTLYEDPAGALSNGAGSYMFAGRTSQAANALRRALVAFPVADFVPAGSSVQSVELRLHMSQSQPGIQTVSLHRASDAWGEAGSNADGGIGGGGNGAPAQVGDATWLHRSHDTQFWTAPGGDYQGPASASQAIGGVGFYTWISTPGMVADVQNWLDHPQENFGWLLVGNESVGGSAKRFSTHENATSEFIPMLTVSYTLPRVCSSETPWNPCDTNCDGSITPFDIQPFIELLIPPCPRPCSTCAGDANDDGTVNQFDIQSFVNCLIP